MRRAVKAAAREAAIGAAIVALASALVAAPALAQRIPLPVPAPQPKTGVLPKVTAQNGLIPPGAIPTPSVPASPPSAAQNSSGPALTIPQLLEGRLNGNRMPAKPGESTAFNQTQRALADRVSGYLSSVQTLIGNFVQIGPDGRRTEGKFYIQKPGRVRFAYAEPSVIDVIADGQSVIVRDRKLATQDLYPLSQTPLRFLLSDRIDLLKDTTVVGVSADDTFVTVVIEEKQTFVGTNRLMLMFGAKDFQLKQWTVTDPQGFDTTVAVYNLDSTKKPDPNLFKINYERLLQ